MGAVDGHATVNRPRQLHGALAGAVTVAGFAFVHDLFISDIWFNVVPMVLAGAGCGVSLVGSYRSTGQAHTPRAWLGYNAACVALLVALGGGSLLIFEPRFTMAEMMVADDALAQLLPPALPLMGAGALAGTAVMTLAFGRRRQAIVPNLVTQVLLVFLVGHNLAVLGLVEIDVGLARVAFEFVGLTAFLGGAFAGLTLLTADVMGRRRPAPRPSTTETTTDRVGSSSAKPKS